MDGETCEFEFLLHGIDSLYCSYYLSKSSVLAVEETLDFDRLRYLQEEIKQTKTKEPMPVKLGNSEFLLKHHGTGSGYSFVIENDKFRIEFGEFIKPNFYVKFHSQALWSESAPFLHKKFLKWAGSVGLQPYQPESVTSVDFCFDYYIKKMEFTADDFKTRAAKDNVVREHKKVQTISFGKSNVMFRFYDKVAEIAQVSHKTWFFRLWGRHTDVWRIEWELKKTVLKKYDIRTIEDLEALKGDVLRDLATSHETLRIPSEDTNESRWPLHPLWLDLQNQIEQIKNLGVLKINGMRPCLEERLERIAISMLGNLKQVAAIYSILHKQGDVSMRSAMEYIDLYLRQHLDQVTWGKDVEKRIKRLELGEW